MAARAADAEKFARALTELPDGRCDVVLLDLRTVPQRGTDQLQGDGLGDTSVQGRAAVELLVRVGRDAVTAGQLARTPAILIYTQESAPQVHVACLIAGASGVVHKADSLVKLGEAIDIAAAGGVVVTEPMATLIDLLANKQRLDLTNAETAVLALAGHGLSRQQIARRLKCAESTVDKHLRAIRDKFGNEVHFTDLADSYGLRDLSTPDTLPAPVRRKRLGILASRLPKRP